MCITNLDVLFYCQVLSIACVGGTEMKTGSKSVSAIK